MSESILKQEDALKQSLNKIPYADRKEIAKDLYKYRDGFPANQVYKPRSWVGKPPIRLSEGEEGIVEFLEYVSDTKLKQNLRCVAVATTVTVASVAMLLLSGGTAAPIIPAVSATGTGSVAVITAKGMTAAVILSRLSTALNLYSAGKSIQSITAKNYSDLLELYMVAEIAALAAEDNCDPVYIASLKEIKEIVKVKPKTVQDLGRLKTFPLNSARVEKYGEKLIEMASIPPEAAKVILAQLEKEAASISTDPLA